jgi:hypothetical protein
MNWRELNAKLNAMSEAEVKQLLDEELTGAKRITFVERLHQRHCALRAVRERAELMASLTAGSQVA